MYVAFEKKYSGNFFSKSRAISYKFPIHPSPKYRIVHIWLKSIATIDLNAGQYSIIFFIIIPLFVQSVHAVDYKYILWIT
jgi:hypothetical protein